MTRCIYFKFVLFLALIGNLSLHAQACDFSLNTKCTVQGNQLSALWNNITRNLHDEISLQTNPAERSLQQNNLISSNFSNVQNTLAPSIALLIQPANSAIIVAAIVAYYEAGEQFLAQLVQGLPLSIALGFFEVWVQQGRVLALTITTSLKRFTRVADPILACRIQALISAQRDVIINYFLGGDAYSAGIEASFQAFVLSNLVGQRIAALQRTR